MRNGKPEMIRKLPKLMLIAGLVVVLDQVTKAMICATIPLHDAWVVIPGFFDITHIRNPGGAFGLLASLDPGVRRLIFLGIAFLALGLVCFFYWSTPKTHPYLAAGFALIFGGAVGNLIDRIRFGSVVDFLDVYVGQWHWPAFNVADSAISVGIGVFVFHVVFNKLPEGLR
ncbi:MAG: signal peptidase II [Deltaproteobacteria bacterium]|nr:signal peptidase II [Deltaproteobacteria bacterium]